MDENAQTYAFLLKFIDDNVAFIQLLFEDVNFLFQDLLGRR